MEDVTMHEANQPAAQQLDSSPVTSLTNNTEVLPAFSLQFANHTYALFHRSLTEQPSTDSEGLPQVLFEGQDGLVQADLAAFMEETRTHFSLRNDVKVTFPTLNNITFDSNMIWAQQVHLCDLAAMHTTLVGSDTPLLMHVEEERNCFLTEYNALIEQVESKKKVPEQPNTNQIEPATEHKTEPEAPTSVPSHRIEEAGEEDDVLIDELEPSGDANPEPQPATSTIVAESEAPIASTNEPMQLTTINSPVSGPLVDAQPPGDNAGLSLEEERNLHYKNQSNTVAPMPDAPSGQLSESSANSGVSIANEAVETHLSSEQIQQEEVLIDDEPVNPNSTYSAPELLDNGVPGAPVPSHDTQVASAADIDPMAVVTEVEVPAVAVAEADVDGDVDVDNENDIDVATPNHRKRARDEPNVEHLAHELKDAHTDPDIDVDTNELQQFEHVAKRPKLDEPSPSTTELAEITSNTLQRAATPAVDITAI